MKRSSYVRAAAWCLGGLLASSPASGNTANVSCQTGNPARPVERFRTVPGQGTFDLWPASLQPADPIDQPLARERDSTLYNGHQRPGPDSRDVDRDGYLDHLEFYWALDIVEDPTGTYLYMAYNSGFQVWDLSGPFAAAPRLLSQRDGWRGDFHRFEPPLTEYYFKIWDIAAIDPPGAPGETFVALPGQPSVGPTIWDVSRKSEPVQLYQDLGKISLQVAAANVGGRSYALHATTSGIEVYDMTRAREVGPCFENTATAVNRCGGNADPVWRGRLGPWPWGRAQFVDVLEVEVAGRTRHFVAVSDEFIFKPLGVEIREITEAGGLPPASVAVVDGLSPLTSGVDLFTIPGRTGGRDRHYLAAVNRSALEIYDVTACLAPASAPGDRCALDAAHRVYGEPLGYLPSSAYLQFSESHGRPFLYQGFHSLCSRPPKVGEGNIEHLLDLSGLATGGPVVDVRGEAYLDPSHASPRRRIDYWSSYYDQSTGGFSTFAPHEGRFHGAYFYRAAQTVFDVHRWIEPEPPPPAPPSGTIFADGFESGGVAAWGRPSSPRRGEWLE